MTWNSPHSPHISESVFYVHNVDRHWKSKTYIAYKIAASARHLTRFGEGPTAQSRILARRVRNLEYMRKVHRRLQSWSRRVARAELRTQQRLWFCELPDSPDSSLLHQPTNVKRTTSINNLHSSIQPTWEIAPNQLINRKTHSWTNGSWSQTDQSWQGHWQHFGWRHSQDLWEPSEYHNWRWLLWYNRIIHSQDTHWTQLTLLMSMMTHNACTQSNLSVSSAVANRLLSSMSKRHREKSATSASAKQEAVHCSGLIARTTGEKNADIDCHSILPEVIQCVKTCVSKILKESTKRRQEHQAPGNCNRLEYQDLGDRLLQKICRATAQGLPCGSALIRRSSIECRWTKVSQESKN